MTRCCLDITRVSSQFLRKSPLRMYSTRECKSPHNSSLTSSIHLHQDNPIGEKRLSRKRYSADNTKGRSKHIYKIINSLKSTPKADASAFFRGLHPRDKLDVLRALVRRRENRVSSLPSYRSNIFEKRYFFKEEDLCEQSTLGRGPGGQATNRRMQTAIIKHIPTEIVVKFSKFPSYWLNRKAAREILNLRLEEYLLGPKSKLGQIKEKRKKRQLNRARTNQKLVERGNIITAKLSQQREFHSILTNMRPFPTAVMLELDSSYSNRTLFISNLFEGECSRWWPMLSTAFSKLNCGNNFNDDNKQNSKLKIPELLHYIFPAVYFSSEQLTSVEKFEWCEIEKCANDKVALRNIERGMRCLIELFGLELQEKSINKDGGNSSLLLVPDGLNWIELRGRMLKNNEIMTPLALSCFSHLFLSLTQLCCEREANAIITFFRRESKKGINGNWAKQGWNSINHVMKEYDLFKKK